jgi:Mn2+/Fe2+ NRAMP family transporter
VQLSRKRRWKQLAILLVFLLIAYVLLPYLADVLGLAAGLSFLAVQVIGYAIFLVGIPFFLWIMAEACYRIFLRPFLRARRIRRIRDHRLLIEAAARK